MKENEIEKLAWSVFLNRTGFRFIRPLTDDEIKSVTGDESYQYYRDIAIKLYEKKQKSILNKKYPIIDVRASGNPCWMEGAYSLLFVYSKYHGNFVLRGYLGEVVKYLKENYTHYFYYKSMWCGGEPRGHWNFWKKDIHIFDPNKLNRKYVVKEYSFSFNNDEDNKKDKIRFEFKRLPKRWIPEFDKF